MKITFDGATNTVTGSKHMLTSPGGMQILLDCGLFQGRGKDTDARNRVFNFDAAQIDAVILSHAHIDHSGNIPLLVKRGFKGKIYCTPATLDLTQILLNDSAHIHENDVVYMNKKRIKNDLPLLEPLYSSEDAENCLKNFKTLEYNTWLSLSNDFKFMFTDAGHILGSAVTTIVMNENGVEKSITYTGDVGRPTDLLIKSPESFPAPDYLITEATYGDRVHGSMKHTAENLLAVIHKTCVEQKGKLLIPSFSLGRTQEIVYALNNLENENKLPKIKVFVDSPLSINATRIMRNYRHGLNDNVQEVLKHDEDPFGFNNLIYVQTVQESMKINEIEGPCIIISASGMLDAGRIKHHLKNNIHDKNSTLLIVGYCTPESLGGKLRTGAKFVKIFGEEYAVKIGVEILDEYSGHAGQDELLQFLQYAKTPKLKKVFIVHGEEDSKSIFKVVLEKDGFTNVIIPKQGEEFEL